MPLLPEIIEIQSWPEMDGMVLFFTDGESAFLLPAGRVFDGSGQDHLPDLAAVQSNGETVTIAAFDFDRGLYLDLTACSRIITLSLAEAAIGQLENKFMMALEHTCILLHQDELVDAIATHQIHASHFHPLLLNLNPQHPIFKNTIPKAFPECQVLTLPMGELEWHIFMIGQHFNYQMPAQWALSGPAMSPLLIGILPPESGPIWFHDNLSALQRMDFLSFAWILDLLATPTLEGLPRDWLSLPETAHPPEEKAPPLTHDFDGKPIKPENQEKMDKVTEAFMLYEKAKLGGNEIRQEAVKRMDEIVKELKRPFMDDPQELSILSQVLNLKGLVEKDLLKVNDAVESLSWAFRISPEGVGKQDIAYNYGYVQLMELSKRDLGMTATDFIRIEHPQFSGIFTFAFPVPLWPGYDQKMKEILGTFEHAANNEYKYSQVAMIYMLLGGTGVQIPVSRRIQHLEAAIDFYRKSAQMTKSADSLDFLNQNRLRCQALLMILKREPKGLFGNRKSKAVIQ